MSPWHKNNTVKSIKEGNAIWSVMSDAWWKRYKRNKEKNIPSVSTEETQNPKSPKEKEVATQISNKQPMGHHGCPWVQLEPRPGVLEA